MKIVGDDENFQIMRKEREKGNLLREKVRKIVMKSPTTKPMLLLYAMFVDNTAQATHIYIYIVIVSKISNVERNKKE